MIKRKSDVLQIRLEAELLERIKVMADTQGVTVSVLIRHYMAKACSTFETEQWRKAESAKKYEQNKGKQNATQNRRY
jgi:post-segregation antitoxin (ccd killing protein)